MKMYHTAALGPQAGGDRTQMTTDQPRGACPKKGPWGNLRMTSRRIPRDLVTYVRLIAASVDHTPVAAVLPPGKKV
jgi:hypothetical protein